MTHPDITESRIAARRLRLYAVVSFTLGWAIAGAAVISWATGRAAFDEAADVVLLIGLGGVVSGVAMYGSAANLRLNATRLELQMRSTD